MAHHVDESLLLAEWMTLRNRIADGYARFVVHIAARHRHRGMELLDAIQVCSIALLDAIGSVGASHATCMAVGLRCCARID